MLTRDLQQGTDWLAHGKIHFYIGSGQPIMKAKKQGLPVDLMPHPLKEGDIMGGGSCCMAVMNRAPHPNATKLFINWVLSREGQSAWQKYTEVNSLRMDIPKSDLQVGRRAAKRRELFHAQFRQVQRASRAQGFAQDCRRGAQDSGESERIRAEG